MSWLWGKGKGSDKPQHAADESPASPQAVAPASTTPDPRKDATDFDPSRLPERKKLPRGMRRLVDKEDKEENFYDELVDGYVPDSTESNVRYAAYATRLRTIMLSAHRYVAYTSDIGESFRPVAHPLARSRWAYILGDVSYEGYKAYWQNQRKINPAVELSDRAQQATGLTNYSTSTPEAAKAAAAALAAPPGEVKPLEDYRTVMVQRGIFQSLASMGLPAFTIHSVVRYSGRAMKNVKNAKLRTYGPIGLGLAVVPALPSLFDKPVEGAVEWLFHKGFSLYGGEEFVGGLPSTGREDALSHKPVSKKPKEKEL
ncbi:mitochondrial 18 KDa protein-domain-containing protein [Apiospora rasikravindrae]|uniref:Mitochondrial fission process protein 1 n=1 Tax=Apiospora rasikravindrae TaxID=990691 RepID=A0ABR1TZQ3_9PEZI